MKKCLLLIIVVIVLMSLGWFRVLLASDFDRMNQNNLEILKQHRQSYQSNGGSVVYYTPEIYDSVPQQEYAGMSVGDTLPYDGTQTAVQSETHGKKIYGSRQLPEFEELEPFGQELFRGTDEIIPPDDIASSDDYVLGPGDNLVVYMWGRVEQEYRLVVDREGKVIIPQVGEMVVWGKTLEEFKELARQKLSRVYSDFDLNVSLGKIRSIRIYLTGEVNRPGAYTVSSLTSLFNALYLAGGPNENGSMRNIRVMRNGKVVAEVDLYRFLLAGDNSLDVRLKSGDAIFVPVAGTRVAIRGEINRPGIYELKGDESALTLLELSGRATPEAHLDRVMLERISGRDEWEVLDLNLNQKSNEVTNLPLRDGDRLTVYSIFESKSNMVAVFGQVKHPGYYERNDTTHVSDLLKRGVLQPYDVYLERANLFRRHADWRMEIIPIDLGAVNAGDSTADLLLKDHDSLHIYSIKDVDWNKYVEIGGEVKEPGKYQFYENMTARDLIFLAGTFKRSASLLKGELARIDSLGQTSIIYIDLDDKALNGIYLKEDDKLYIRQIPEWPKHRTVTIEGEMRFPGEYMLSDRNETLYSLMQRAGGFTSNAFPRGMILQRPSIEENLERLQIPKLLENSSPLVQDTAGNLKRDMVFDYEIHSINRIVIDVEKIMASNGEKGDIVLEPGDKIFVPSVPSGISVLGAVGSSGTIKYQSGKNTKYYIEKAGNFVNRSDKKGTRLIRATGEVISGGSALGKRVELGDIIVVPTKIKKEKDWTKTITVALSATTSVLTTLLLIDKL